jgi:hypothetical protein
VEETAREEERLVVEATLEDLSEEDTGEGEPVEEEEGVDAPLVDDCGVVDGVDSAVDGLVELD